jgi:AraC-like DNA-binding protein
MSTEHTQFIDQAKLLSVVPTSVTWEQLEPGILDVGFRVLRIGPLVVSLRTVNLAVHAYVQVAPNKAGAMAVESRSDAQWRGSTFDAAKLGIGDEVDVRTTGPSTLYAIAVDQHELQQTCPDSLDADDLVDGLARNIVANRPSAASRFRSAVKAACAHDGALPPGANGTLIPMLAAVLDRIDDYSTERSHSLNRRYAAVRACDRYMRERIDDTITLLDLSRIAGMRSRSLINAFKAIMGYSPMDYLKRLRLSSVRSALLRADARSTKVTDVAMDWGFGHMGHFTQHYRAMFGEMPSQTLAGGRHGARGT